MLFKIFRFLIKTAKTHEPSTIEDFPEPTGLDKSETLNEISDESMGTAGTATEPELEDYDSSSEEDKIEQKTKKKKYERKFNKTNLKNSKFKPWLIKKAGSGFCKLCMKRVNGGAAHYLRHMDSLAHRKFIEKAGVTPSITKFSSIAESQEKHFKGQVYGAELKLMMFIAEHNLPFLIMDHLTGFLKSVAPDSKIVKSIKCNRTKSTQLMTQVIGQSNTKEISCDLKDKFFSILIDESTDIATKKSLAIVVRYFKCEKVVDRFLDLIEVSDGTAQGIYDSLVDCITNHGIEMKNVVGFGSDNASVMMGRHNGVQAKLKEQIPNLFVWGCLCHSLHLLASAACEILPKWLEQLTRDIYNHFSNSSKRQSEFKEFQLYLDIEPHKILKPGQTRWLSLEVIFDSL